MVARLARAARDVEGAAQQRLVVGAKGSVMDGSIQKPLRGRGTQFTARSCDQSPSSARQVRSQAIRRASAAYSLRVAQI